MIWDRGEATDAFKPIASAEDGGVVKFFGRVNDGNESLMAGDNVNGLGPFGDIGAYVSLDEDVISGEENTPPVMTLNISVPDASGSQVQLQVIYYETSGIEYIQGGDKCFGDPDNATGNLEVDSADEARAAVQAACTSDEINSVTDRDENDAFVLHAESDEDAGADNGSGGQKQLALIETGRFTGVFQGFLRLTDADGNGPDADGNQTQTATEPAGVWSRRAGNSPMPNWQTALRPKNCQLREPCWGLAMVR